MSLFKKISAFILKKLSKFKRNDWQKKTKRFHRHDELLVQKLNTKRKLPTKEQLIYSFKYLSDVERLVIRVLFGVVFVCVIALCLNIYWQNSSLEPKIGGTYSEGLVGAPRYINPLFAQGNDVDLDLVEIIYSGLFKYSAEGIIPDVAESFEISEDQKVYTIKLRSDVFFHDGEKLDIEDVLFTFSRIQNPRSKTPLYYNFQGVLVEKIDENSLKISLSEPFSPFLENLTVGILPEHIWKNIEPENMLLAEYNLKPIGSGPFKFSSLTKNANGKIKNFTFTNNNQYHFGQPYIEEFDLKFYESFDLAVDALNNKKIDGLSYLPKELRDRIINNRNINFNLLQLPQYTAVFFNYEKNPILKELEIRKTLAKGIDKNQLINELQNAEAQTINGPILNGYLGYTEDLNKLEFNILEARESLEKSDWKLNEYPVENESSEPYPFQVRKHGNRFLEFTLTTVEQAEIVKVAKKIQSDWKQLGVKVNLKFVKKENISTIIASRDYEALLYGQILGADPDPYPFWHSSQKVSPGLNLTSFGSSEADKLLEEARKTIKPEDRAQKYISFQKILTDNVPAIFLYSSTYTYPQHKILKSSPIKKIITPANRFANITSWYIKTTRNWNK